MKFKFILFSSVLLLIPLILAYNYQINVDSNYADFNTDVYKCTDSGCSNIIFHFSSTTGEYSLVGSGDNYYAEYDYKACYKPHLYIIHAWGSGTENYNILFNKKENCKAIINNSELSDNNIELGEKITITSKVHSGFEYPAGIPKTTAIPSNITNEYSTNTKVSFYANGIKINETEAEILLASDKDFEFEWTPSTAGTYEISVKSEVVDCACSSQITQEFLIGTLVVNELPVLNTYYKDLDNDGYSDGTTQNASSKPSGYKLSSELISTAIDCNDNNANIHPDALEICGDGIDNDCSGGDAVCPILNTYYKDLDNDDYGNASNPIQSTTQPAGYVTDNTDCNDNNANIHPGATEICNGVDDDCDGQIDENNLGNSLTQSCYTGPFGTKNIGICNEGTQTCLLGSWSSCIGETTPQTETCDGSLDEDCNSIIDNGCPCTNGDTKSCGTDIGECSFGTQTCSSGNWGDCQGGVNPIAEICGDILDNDCDGQTNEGCDISAPIVNLLFPFNNQIFYGVSYFVDFIFSVNDASDISGCYVDVSGSQYQNTTLITKTGNNTRSVNLPHGNYIAKVFCTDIFNNQGNSNQISFEIAQMQCSADSDCNSDFYSDKYCSSGDVYKDYHDFGCAIGSCAENIIKELVKECDNGCKNGQCKSDESDEDSWCTETNSCELTYNDSTEFDDLITLKSTDNKALDLIKLNNSETEPVSYFWVLIIIIAIIVVLILLLLINLI